MLRSFEYNYVFISKIIYQQANTSPEAVLFSHENSGVFQQKQLIASNKTTPVQERGFVFGGKYSIVINFVLNLDRAADRWKKFQTTWNHLGIPYERIPGVDGKGMSVADVDQSILQTHGWEPNPALYGRSTQMTPGEIGCGLSHIRAWQKIASLSVSNDFDMHCILEDDAIPTSDYKNRLAQVLSELPTSAPADILYLYRFKISPSGHIPVPEVKHSEHVNLLHGTSGFVGYCLSHGASVKLIRMLPVVCSVDNWIGLELLPRGNVSGFASRQNVLTIDGKVPSLIGQHSWL